MVIKEKCKLAIHTPLLCSWHLFQLKFAHVWLHHKFLGHSPKATKTFFPPMWLFLDYSESHWPRNRWFSSISWVPEREKRGGRALQELSRAGSGSLIPRFLVTFWKEGEYSETTKLLSALIWPTAHNSCKSWILQGGKKNKVKTGYNVVLWKCIVFRRGKNRYVWICREWKMRKTC